MRILLLYLCSLLLCLGCSDNLFKPAAEFAIVQVNPYYVEWEKTGDNASATFSLPNITVSLRNETAIPAYLTSISVKYSTKLGDSISQLPQYSRKYEITLAANSTTDFEVALYYPDILNFVEFTTSDIFPINATIFVEITDVNNNKIYSEANCIVYKPDDRVAYTAPVTTTNPTPPPTTTDPETPVVPVTPVNPSIEIIRPQNGEEFRLEGLVFFVGIASPTTPVSNILWRSSVDGVIAENTLTTATSTLSLGAHTIELSAMVAGENVDDSIRILIQE